MSNEAKFTKCEWQYENGCGSIYTPEGYCVCDFTESNTNEHVDYNAHLIKASPKMYEMLERLVGFGFEWNDEDDPMREEINQLLAEARGEHDIN